jgi:hypothetical protein
MSQDDDDSIPWDCLLDRFYTLQRLYSHQSRLRKIIDTNSSSSDTSKFVLRLLYLLYGKFEDPLCMYGTDLFIPLQDVEFRTWAEIFTRDQICDVVCSNNHQLDIVKRFLASHGDYIMTYYQDEILYYIILRMYIVVFFQNKNK